MGLQVVPCVLRPALPSAVEPGDLPNLPEWAPLDPRPTADNPNPEPYTAETRAAARRAKALAVACEGPYDGRRGEALVYSAGPQAELHFADGMVTYRLDMAASTPACAVYRYDPRSPIHRRSMGAIEDAYREYGLDYTREARLQTPVTAGGTLTQKDT